MLRRPSFLKSTSTTCCSLVSFSKLPTNLLSKRLQSTATTATTTTSSAATTTTSTTTTSSSTTKLNTFQKKPKSSHHQQQRKATPPWQRAITTSTNENQQLDTNQWKSVKPETVFANELMAVPHKYLDAGVILHPIRLVLQNYELSGTTHLFTRYDSRKLCAEIIAQANKKPGSKFAITGHAGIGKSRTLTYLLQQLLLQRKTVLYESRRQNKIIIFVPTTTTTTSSNSSSSAEEKNEMGAAVAVAAAEEMGYEAFCADLTSFSHDSCVALMDPNNFYLVDDEASLAGKLFSPLCNMVVSVDPSHSYLQREGMQQYVLQPWSKKELEAVAPYYPVDGHPLTPRELNARYYIFGGRPEYVFQSDGKIRKLRDSMLEMLKTLPTETIDKVLTNSLSSLDTLPKLLFGASQVQSTTYKASQNNTVLTIASEFIEVDIIKKHWSHISSRYLANGNDKQLLNWRAFVRSTAAIADKSTKDATKMKQMVSDTLNAIHSNQELLNSSIIPRRL